jgi:hypothetical protein
MQPSLAQLASGEREERQALQSVVGVFVPAKHAHVLSHDLGVRPEIDDDRRSPRPVGGYLSDKRRGDSRLAKANLVCHEKALRPSRSLKRIPDMRGRCLLERPQSLEDTRIDTAH